MFASRFLLVVLVIQALSFVLSDTKMDEMHGKKSKAKVDEAMICYPRKSMEKKEPMMLPEKLLEQASRLLGVAMTKTGDIDTVSMNTLKKITEIVKNVMMSKKMKPEMTKPEMTTESPTSVTPTTPTPSELGDDLLGIVKDLIGDSDFLDIPGLTITRSEISPVDPPSPPMHDEPQGMALPGMLGEGLDLSSLDIPGLDLNNLDLSGIDLSTIDLSKIDLSNLDLGAIMGFLGGGGMMPPPEDGQDGESTEIVKPSTPDLSSIIGMLGGGGGMPPIKNPLEEEDDEGTTARMPPQAEIQDDGSMNLGGIDLQSILGMLGGGVVPLREDGEIDIDKLDIQAIIGKLAPLGKDGGIDFGKIDLQAILAMFGGGDPGKPKKEKSEEEKEREEKQLERLLGVIGVNGEDITDDEDILPAVLKAMQFILDADEETLKSITATISDIDISIFDDLFEMEEEGSKGQEMICYKAGDKVKAAILRAEKKNVDEDDDEEEGCSANVCEDIISDLEENMASMVKMEVQKAIAEMTANLGSLNPSLLGFLLPGSENKESIAGERKLTGALLLGGQWSEWSICSAECDGISTRSRECKDDRVEECVEEEAKSCGKKCLTMENEKWLPWTDWDSCTQSCGGGISIRSRMCLPEYMTEDESECEESESRSCNTHPCTGMMIVSEEDKWTQWTEWDPCTESCGGGVSIRSRMCKDEFMTEDYTACEQAERKECNVQSCDISISQVDRVWGEWSIWDDCTALCDGGTTRRIRMCLDGEEDCEEIESRMCNTDPCLQPEVSVTSIQDWLEWGEWDACSVSCGLGSTTRKRSCVRKATTSKCEQVQSKSCQIEECATQTPPPPEWLEWRNWSECSASCGTGVRTRLRQCVRKSFMSECEQVESESCMTDPCPTQPPVPVWNQWSDWTSCAATCGSSSSFRTRTCSNSEEMGIECKESEARMCDMAACEPVWQWGDWTDWSPCNVTCGSGQRSRIRSCASGVCVGDSVEIASCTGMNCMQMRETCPISQYQTLRFGDSCVVFHGREVGRKSFSEMRSRCMQDGGDMVEIMSVDQWVRITYWLKLIAKVYYRGVYEGAWIGATDAGHHGQWSHPNGDGKRLFTIWRRGEPQTSNVDQCAILNSSSGHGSSAACSAANYGICQYNLKPKL